MRPWYVGSPAGLEGPFETEAAARAYAAGRRWPVVRGCLPDCEAEVEGDPPRYVTRHAPGCQEEDE